MGTRPKVTRNEFQGFAPGAGDLSPQILGPQFSIARWEQAKREELTAELEAFFAVELARKPDDPRVKALAQDFAELAAETRADGARRASGADLVALAVLIALRRQAVASGALRQSRGFLRSSSRKAPPSGDDDHAPVGPLGSIPPFRFHNFSTRFPDSSGSAPRWCAAHGLGLRAFPKESQA